MNNLKLSAVGVLALVCLFGFGSCVTSIPYSEGHRDGYVQKFSHKGILRKSWEGDLALSGATGNALIAATNVWKFTVSDPEVVKQVNQVNAGQLVRLHYNEYLYTVGGETNYRVSKIEVLRER